MQLCMTCSHTLLACFITALPLPLPLPQGNIWNRTGMSPVNLFFRSKRGNQLSTMNWIDQGLLNPFVLLVVANPNHHHF